MDPDAQWDDVALDDLRPIPIGDILPEVLAKYGLWEPSMGCAEPVPCGDMATAAFTMTEVS